MVYVPSDILRHIVGFVDDQTLVNTCIGSKDTMQECKSIIDCRKRVYDAKENGKRYARVISIAESILEKDAYDILKLLEDPQYHADMKEWGSLIQLGDVFRTNTYWPETHMTLCAKLRRVTYVEWNAYQYVMSLESMNGSKSNLGALTPASILIPPRTDIML